MKITKILLLALLSAVLASCSFVDTKWETIETTCDTPSINPVEEINLTEDEDNVTTTDNNPTVKETDSEDEEVTVEEPTTTDLSSDESKDITTGDGEGTITGDYDIYETSDYYVVYVPQDCIATVNITYDERLAYKQHGDNWNHTGPNAEQYNTTRIWGFNYWGYWQLNQSVTKQNNGTFTLVGEGWWLISKNEGDDFDLNRNNYFNNNWCPKHNKWF